MDKQTRIDIIKEITSKPKNEMGRQEIVWQDDLQSMPYFKIPLDSLIYNKYNGRILTRTKSIESQGKVINPETLEGKELIEGLLWKSKIDRNKQTLKDLETWGQKNVGIITADGIIIDGNRRAMLLNRGRHTYFKAIVLPVTLEENPIEIEKLETSFQMGEDEKLGYNPIEKYLKAKNLERKNIALNDIASWMGEAETEVKRYIHTMDVMEDYLDFFGYKGMYTQLDGREDQFLTLSKWIQNFYGEGSARGFDGYRDDDVDDLRAISYDYIRAEFEGKKFRLIADGNKESHIFGHKDIWADFTKNHFTNVDPVRRDEEKIPLGSPDLEKALKSRDSAFKAGIEQALNDNLDDHYESLNYKKHADEPGKLIAKAIDAAKVAKTNKNVSNNDVIAKIEELNNLTIDMMTRKSPASLLRHISEQLEAVDAQDCQDNVEAIEKELKNIQHVAYRLSKEL